MTELHEPCRSIRHADTHHRLRLYSQSYIYIYVSRVDTRRGQERSFCSKSSGVELVSSSSFPFTFSSPRRRRRKRRRNTHNSKEKKNNKKKEIKGKKGKGSHFLPLFGSPVPGENTVNLSAAINTYCTGPRLCDSGPQHHNGFDDKMGGQNDGPSASIQLRLIDLFL